MVPNQPPFQKRKRNDSLLNFKTEIFPSLDAHAKMGPSSNGAQEIELTAVVRGADQGRVDMKGSERGEGGGEVGRGQHDELVNELEMDDDDPATVR
jgi:hypothetical protein